MISKGQHTIEWLVRRKILEQSIDKFGVIKVQVFRHLAVDIYQIGIDLDAGNVRCGRCDA